jgi:hypothetical protein
MVNEPHPSAQSETKKRAWFHLGISLASMLILCIIANTLCTLKFWAALRIRSVGYSSLALGKRHGSTATGHRKADADDLDVQTKTSVL